MIAQDWDNTKLSAWQNCEQQGHYAHPLDGPGIIVKEPSPALAFGLGFHAAAEEWCNQVVRMVPEDEAAQYQAFLQARNRELSPEIVEHIDTTQDKHSIANFQRLFRGYKEKFPVSLYKPLEVERPFRLRLGEAKPGLEIYWTGILDRIVEFQGGIYFLELKTASHRIDEAWLRQFQVSGQLRGYIWAGQELLGKAFDGAIIHGVEKAPIPKTGRARGVEELIGASMVEVAPELIEEWRHNTLDKIAQVNDVHVMGRYKMNLGDACNAYNFSGCPYRDLCGAPIGVRAQIMAERYVKRVWNPLAERRSQIVG